MATKGDVLDRLATLCNDFREVAALVEGMPEPGAPAAPFRPPVIALWGDTSEDARQAVGDWCNTLVGPPSAPIGVPEFLYDSPLAHNITEWTGPGGDRLWLPLQKSGPTSSSLFRWDWVLEPFAHFWQGATGLPAHYPCLWTRPYTDALVGPAAGPGYRVLELEGYRVRDEAGKVLSKRGVPGTEARPNPWEGYAPPHDWETHIGTFLPCDLCLDEVHRGDWLTWLREAMTEREEAHGPTGIALASAVPWAEPAANHPERKEWLFHRWWARMVLKMAGEVYSLPSLLFDTSSYFFSFDPAGYAHAKRKQVEWLNKHCPGTILVPVWNGNLGDTHANSQLEDWTWEDMHDDALMTALVGMAHAGGVCFYIRGEARHWPNEVPQIMSLVGSLVKGE